MIYCVQCGNENLEAAAYFSTCGRQIYHGSAENLAPSHSGVKTLFVAALLVVALIAVGEAVYIVGLRQSSNRNATIASHAGQSTTASNSGTNTISSNMAGAYVGQTLTIRMNVESVLDDLSDNGDQYLYPVANPGPTPVFYYSGFDIVRFMDALDAGAPPLSSYLGKTVDVTGEVTNNGSGGYEILVSPVGGTLQVVSG